MTARSPGPITSGLAVALALAAGAAACAEPRDRITDPASPQAAAIDGLWTLSLVLGVTVWVVVMALLAVPVWRSSRRRGGGAGGTEASDAPTAAVAANTPADRTVPRGGAAAEHRVRDPGLDEPLATADPRRAREAGADHPARRRLVWIGGVITPAVILVVLLVASGRVGAMTAHVERDGELVIDVVGHMFWWEVHYPEEGVTTANEIHVPVDRPVRLNLTTEDVIHSFWIPRVHGKIDMIPGRENVLTFEPTRTGRFRGQCAEYCGIAHAQMVAFLEVQPPDEFDAWLEAQRRDAVEPDTPRTVEGQRVFLEAGCASCHAVRGTAAVAGVGPDLTHLMSRQTIAAGIAENRRGELERLIVDPWGVKPGNPMPPTPLDDDELTALLDYLETLQ